MPFDEEMKTINTDNELFRLFRFERILNEGDSNWS